jgi:hypothetical protein
MSAYAYPDRLLIEARDDSVRLEKIAVQDLRQNIDGYLVPNWRTRRLVEGYARYVETGQNDNDEYLNLRAAFTETLGKSNKVFSDVIATHIPNKKYDMSDTLFGDYLPNAAAGKPAVDANDTTINMVNGEDGEDQTSEGWDKVIHGAVRHLELHGYWKSKINIPDRMVESLKKKTLGKLVEDHGNKVDAILAGKPGAPLQIKGDSRWCATFEELYELSSDPFLLSIVQAYMGAPPIFQSPIAFLNSYSKVTSEKQLSDTAQLYHHDMHRLSFVKLFIYLTDVELGSGPHTLIKGTHRKRPDALWADGRHTDETVTKAGLIKNEVKITGKQGTIFLVDTSALHKGAHPETESRLMAQVQYTNSLFGRPLASSDHKIEKAKSKNADIQLAADHVRKYAARSGIRFMQNYI